MNDEIFVEVVVDRYVDRVFDYKLPPNLANKVFEGSFVKVSFKNEILIACVVRIKKQCNVPIEKLKSVMDIIDYVPSLKPNLLKLSQWISEYYASPLGQVISSMVPSFIFKKVKNPRFSKPKEMQQENMVFDVNLNDEQNKAYESIWNNIQKNVHKVFLLFGVTGSGKTEVYIKIIQKVFELNKTALIIVPEIALTPQLITLFQKRFNEKVAIFHSRLSSTARRDYWMKVANKEIKVVLGARSAVFAPLENIGIIIVDEEHERTYKQEDSPKYNARDIAVVRGVHENCTVLLCSATPSLESYYNCMKKKYEMLMLNERVFSRNMPNLELVDMSVTSEFKRFGFFFSSKLLNLIQDRLNKKEKTILFVNKRGYSTCEICADCQKAIKCSQCSISMTYHKEDGHLICHRCKTSIPPVKICPACKSKKMKFIGFGTEKVEKSIKKIFPNAEVARIDSDNARKKDFMENTWTKFINGKIDILVGTQMIAKGIHMEAVTLVSVLFADMTLNIPDFRSAENTFQLITQVAGRAGRGEIPGKVIIQTNGIDNPVLIQAMNLDYKSFYETELKFRKDFFYPPFSRFIMVLVTNKKDSECAKTAHEFHSYILQVKDLTETAKIYPPVPAPIARIKASYRYHILIATVNVKKTVRLLKSILDEKFPSKSTNFSLDIDPYSML